MNLGFDFLGVFILVDLFVFIMVVFFILLLIFVDGFFFFLLGVGVNLFFDIIGLFFGWVIGKYIELVFVVFSMFGIFDGLLFFRFLGCEGWESYDVWKVFDDCFEIEIFWVGGGGCEVGFIVLLLNFFFELLFNRCVILFFKEFLELFVFVCLGWV